MERIDHVNLSVSDLDGSLRFYRDELGLELVRDPEDFRGDHAMFRTSEHVITLMETGRGHFWEASELDHPLDKAHLALETGRDAFSRLIERLDGQFPNQGPYDWGEFEGFYVLDPSGNLLEVITRDPPADRTRPLLTHSDIDGSG